jgi:hypothetical protein
MEKVLGRLLAKTEKYYRIDFSTMFYGNDQYSAFSGRTRSEPLIQTAGIPQINAEGMLRHFLAILRPAMLTWLAWLAMLAVFQGPSMRQPARWMIFSFRSRLIYNSSNQKADQ